MTIERLSKVSELAPSDLVALFSSGLGGDAAATLQTLLGWLQSQLSAEGGFVTQYAAPSATAFNVQLVPPSSGSNLFLILSPAGAYADGTITLPAKAESVNEQEVLVHCTQGVTALVVGGNGATVNGAPTTIAAGGFFKLRFDGVFGAWYRVG